MANYSEAQKNMIARLAKTTGYADHAEDAIKRYLTDERGVTSKLRPRINQFGSSDASELIDFLQTWTSDADPAAALDTAIEALENVVAHGNDEQRQQAQAALTALGVQA